MDITAAAAAATAWLPTSDPAPKFRIRAVEGIFSNQEVKHTIGQAHAHRLYCTVLPNERTRFTAELRPHPN